jgi:hypothetical protein
MERTGQNTAVPAQWIGAWLRLPTGSATVTALEG